MSAAVGAELGPGTQRPRDVTLLELVSAISEFSRDEGEVVATVLYLLRAGRVRLRGNFRGTPVEDLA